LKPFAILLDTRPAYLDVSGPASLLLAPLGPATVLRYLGERLSSMSHARLTIATDFEPTRDYEDRVRDAGAAVDAILPARELAARITEYEPSDWLVIVDPRCVPSQGLKARALLQDTDGGPRRVRHLVALEAHPGGTTERVHLGANGAVGRIQRYYDSATWPFTSGVSCSLLPVSCTMGASDLPFTSLRALRRGLANRGVPSSDVFVHGGAFNLSREGDLLSLSERLVLDHFSRRGFGHGWLEVGPGCRIDPSARLVGPVVVQAGAFIGADATVVGPAVLGAGARVEDGAMVAQCVLGPDAVVATGLTVRHRALFGTVCEDGAGTATAPAYEPDPAPAVECFEAEGAPPASAYRSLKAAFDVATSALGLLLLLPLFLVIAALVKLESRGPVFYRDRREGKGGRVFKCLKFRTMCAGADLQQRELLAGNRNEVDGPQFKLARDPRVTRVGRVLRKLNLDELPQLVNVLLLQMSLVGPRPSPFRENQLCVPWRDGRLSVRPGITGLWQVCRDRRTQADFHQWIHFDLLYVRHMSFLVDLKILAATLFSLAGQWPVPLAWIVSLHEPEGAPPVPPSPSGLRVPATDQAAIGKA
jgi:lipopolysaccharide/colanic/teichoic acid biosynthesis glycosyltransferase/carbonic anhydrase/acetyltransferase-like protein (isoleucine patch superfamily)